MNITSSPPNLDGATRAQVVMNALYAYACLDNWDEVLELATQMAHAEMENLTEDSNEDDLDYAHGLAEGLAELHKFAGLREASKLNFFILSLLRTK